MPKVKPKRSIPSIDMTAMVDVAFLLLTFFILTTRFKAEDVAAVDPPKAATADTISLDRLILYTVDQDGRVYMGLGDIQDRENMLDMVSSRMGFVPSEEGRNYFRNSSSFGMPFTDMKRWLSLTDPEALKDFEHTGIPIDLTPGRVNELKIWTNAAVRANRSLEIGVKGDLEASYDDIFKVITTLQDLKLNSFRLISHLEGED